MMFATMKLIFATNLLQFCHNLKKLAGTALFSKAVAII